MPITVIDTIEAKSSGYPVVVDTSVQGGYQVVSTLAQMYAIPISNQKVGMMIYVTGNTTFYQCNSIGNTAGNFTVVSFGGFTAGSDLIGSSTNQTVIGIRGVPVNNAATSTNAGYALVTNSSGQYVQNGVAPVFNVKNFGAKGDSTTDDTTAIQACFDSAAAFVQNIPNGLYQSGQLGGVSVQFPNGQYKISSELGLKAGICLYADHYALLFTSSNISIIRTAAAQNNITNIAFSGGKHHITAYGYSSHYGAALGSPAGAYPTRFTNCCFKYSTGPSFYVDNTPNTASPPGSFPTGIPNTGAAFYFDMCEIIGPCAYYGCADGLFYENCYCCLDSTTGAFDTNGNILAFWTSGDHLSIQNCIGIPTDTAARYPAWAGGAGIFKFADFRFGGEASTVSAIRLRQLVPYNGLALGLGWANPSEVYIDTCELTCAGATSWIEVYDQMPRVVSLRMGMGSNPFDNIQGGTELVGSWGIYVDENTVPISSYVNRDVRGLQFLFDHVSDINAFRIYTSSTLPSLDPIGFTDLTPYLRKHVNPQIPIEISQTPQNNLFIYNIVRATDFTPTYDNITGAGNETKTGYSLNNLTATSDGASLSLLTTTSWDGYAGEYTFSMIIRSTYGGRAILGYIEGGITTVCSVCSLDGSGEFQRIATNFYHDGYSKQFFFEAFDIPENGILTPGLPAIHSGKAIHPYTFPVDSPTIPANNTTVEGSAISIYYAAAVPSAGSYIVGDKVINTTPTAITPIEWICTVAGSPGTFIANYPDLGPNPARDGYYLSGGTISGTSPTICASCAVTPTRTGKFKITVSGVILNNAGGPVTIQVGYGHNGSQDETFYTLNALSSTYVPVNLVADDYQLTGNIHTIGTPVTFDFFLTAGAGANFSVPDDAIQLVVEEWLG